MLFPYHGEMESPVPLYQVVSMTLSFQSTTLSTESIPVSDQLSASALWYNYNTLLESLVIIPGKRTISDLQFLNDFTRTFGNFYMF